VDKHFNNQNLYQRLRNLTAIKESERDMTHTTQFKQCDKTMVARMLAAESTTKKNQHYDMVTNVCQSRHKENVLETSTIA
jgi:hypothetical protein